MAFKTPEELARTTPTWQEAAAADPATVTLRERVERAQAAAVLETGQLRSEWQFTFTEDDPHGREVKFRCDVLTFTVDTVNIPLNPRRLVTQELQDAGWIVDTRAYERHTWYCEAYVNRRPFTADS